MLSTAIPTQFAPAERASKETIYAQATYFGSLEMLDSLYSAIPDGVLILNEHRQIVYANPVVLTLFNFQTLEEALGQRLGEALGCIHAFDTPGGCGTTTACSTCGAMKAILQAQAGHKNTQECRISIKTHIGEAQSLDFRVTATPKTFAGNQYTIFSLVDISNEKRRRIFERLFFHDIGNTAGAIFGLAEILSETQSLEELQEMEYCALLSTASHQLLDEIQAQRQLISAEGGDLLPQPTTFSTVAFLTDVLNTYKKHPVAENKYLFLDTKCDDVMISSDKTILGRLVANMVKNGLEACGPREGVTIGSERTEDGVRFWVHNPAFILPRNQLQIFQRSFSTKGSDRGLGTYSIRLLAENYLQGQVGFDSTEEAGTLFWGIFPLKLETPETE